MTGNVVAFAICMLSASMSGQALYEEHFDQKGKFTDSRYAYHFNGAYHIYDVDGRWSMETDLPFKDFVAELRTEFMGGASNYGYGIIFRCRDLRNFYEFRISGNGQFGMGMYIDKKWSRLRPWKENTAIRTEGINYLRVEAVGSVFRLFANGVLLDTVQHDKYSSGFIGLVAYDSVHAHFDDLVVSTTGTPERHDYDFSPTSRSTVKDYPYSDNDEFLENFIDRTHQWGESEHAFYHDDSYTIFDPHSDHYSTQHVSCQNVELEVNFRVLEWSKDGSAGILFGMSDDDNYASLTVSEAGVAAGIRRTDGARSNLIHPTPIPSFDKDAIQTITVQIRKNNLHFFVNGNDIGNSDDERGFYSSSDRVGLFAGQAVRADFLSIRTRSLDFSWFIFASELVHSTPVWVCTMTSFLGAVLVAIGRRRKRAIRKRQFENQIFDAIKAGGGLLRLGPIMAKYRVTRKEAQNMLDDAAAKFGGQASLEADGGITYEFPDFMPSEEAIQAEIISFAAMRKGRLTVTDTANFLKKDLIETETLLDEMVDGRRVKKSEDKGVTYYEFPEILQSRK